MQISQPERLRPGACVTARGTRWHVVDVRAFDTCRIVTLSSCGAPPGAERRLLEPFDDIDAVRLESQPRVVGARRWRSICRAALAGDTPPGRLREGPSARIDLMPHQLEPALAVLAGQGTRVLLADEVGLGKTIQAGLILAELRARGWIDRILVLTPAGLRDQWRRELAERLGLEATNVDGRALRFLSSQLPLGVNPWSTVPIAVASADYVKRPEILPSVSACRWDAVVVDEAHGTAGDSDRRAAMHAIASRASYVLLLTATPHSGDPATFTSLCGIGSAGESLLAFRRRRSDVRPGSRRRIHTIRVRLSTEERQALSALRRYGAAVLGENPSAAIALSVLDKRAFSSPWSLAQSVDRRLAVLDATGSSADEAQMALPLGDPDGDRLVEDAPPAWPSDLELRDRQRDRRLLRAVLEASRAAVGRERKIAALRRLLRRTEEPAIVFTEYRDTLVHLQRALGGVPTVVIHGGMTQPERAAAITAFERGRRAVLLATDAAGEGLNLQRHCRLVVNLELPWNPVRLEQRIGRVDRIGQTRTVHAVHLVAAGTGELRILERLHARVARAQAAIGAADPVGGRDAFAPWPTGGGAIEFPDFHGAAPAEADRLQRSRSWSAGANRGGSKVEPRVPAIVRTSRTGLRSVLGSRALLVWRVAIVSNSGPALESTIAGVTLQGLTAARTPSDQTRTVRQLTDRISAAVGQSSCGWREAAMRVLAAFVRTRLTRERAILAALSGSAPGEFQPGLFDGRAVRAQEQALLRVKDASQHVVDRIASVERLADVTVLPPVLLLAVVP